MEDNIPTFTWTTVSDPSGVTYSLQVDNDDNFSSPEIDATGLTENAYTLTVALSDDNYSWRVRAVDGANNSSDWSTVWTLLIDTTAPLAPVLLEPADGMELDDDTPTFRWTAVIDPSGVTYTIWVDNDADFSSPEVNVSDLTDNTYALTIALANDNYSWRVCAVDDVGHTSDWSATWSFEIEAEAPPPPPPPSPPPSPPSPAPSLTPLMLYGTLTAVIGGSAVAYYVFFIRPIKPAISLKHLGKISPREISPLERLVRAPRTVEPAIKLERLASMPMRLGIRLERLKEVARPTEPTIQLQHLREVARPAEPAIQLKRLRKVLLGPGSGA
jgi:hypothetical protein